MSDDETLAVYAAKAEEYARLTDDFNTSDPRLEAFIAAMPPKGHVLDLGCGPGTSAALMALAGLQVTAYDPVPQMVALAARHTGVSAREAGFADVSGIDLYDGIWASFSLLHALRTEMPDYLQRISKALKPGGRFDISVKTGEGEARDGLGRYYTYYTDSELTGLIDAAGLTVTNRVTGRDRGLAGDLSDWFALSARA